MTTFTIKGHTAVYGDAGSGPALSGYRVSGYCDNCGEDDSIYAATDGDFFEQFLAHAERVS